jgi:hypothetical protein
MRIQKTRRNPSGTTGSSMPSTAQVSNGPVSIAGQVIIMGASQLSSDNDLPLNAAPPRIATHAPRPGATVQAIADAPEEVWIALEDMLRKREAAKRAAAMRLHPSRKAQPQ